MAKQKQLVRFGAAPRVDLLPAAQREDLRLERLMPRLGLAIVASAALAGLIWAAGFVPVQAAQQQLEEAEGETTVLITQIAQFSDLQKTLSKESGLAKERQTLTKTEVMFGDRLNEIRKLLPSDLRLTEYHAQLTSDDPTATLADPFKDLNPLCVAKTATLTMQFEGDGLVLDKAAKTVAAMNEKSVTGFQCVVGTKVVVQNEGDPQVVLVQIALGQEALALRFEEKKP